MKRKIIFFLFVLVFNTACSSLFQKQLEEKSITPLLIHPNEKRFKSMVQLTFFGNNAEGYFSFDDSMLVFQSDWNYRTQTQRECDQIYRIDISSLDFTKNNTFQYELISTGKGRTTCSYFLKDNQILYSSTHEIFPECPNPIRTYQGKYVWQLFDYDIYLFNPKTKELKKFVANKGYDAEATVSPDGRYVVYTSMKSGDLEIWRKDLITGEEKQLTNELGYDGGAFFSYDSKKIVWRASRPKTKEEITLYKELLSKNLVQPSELNVYVMDADGKNKKQVTFLPGTNWSPFFHPSDQKILFSSNHHVLQKGGRTFHLFMINIDGTNLEQVTFGNEFESFPMFSFHKHKDHYWLVFASNRNAKRPRDTNLFIAEWVD
ncbi:MAG: hypothetical protein NZ853_01370 [Leptospiraceae bacterium]|nr:hypothetical protein [Leptospiraceae bacterium]MDW7976122.1 hypothetical protein [Leptospiraceae bacterium]